MQNVAIVGVGLIGGSFALALRKSGFQGTITGVSSPAALAEALALNIIDSGAPLEQAARAADLIYLAQPIGRILDTLRRLDPHVRPEALVTDAGSTKQAIMDAARTSLHRCQFLGGHPMAGKEIRGAAAADANLFQNRPYILTPPNPEALQTAPARTLIGHIERMGARVVTLGADEHDRLVAFSSHLPQLASTALASLIAETDPKAAQVAGPGLLDTTRLAMSSYDLWRDIVATNEQPIEEALTAYIQKLEHLRENLRTRELQSEFTAGAQFAKQLRQITSSDPSTRRS